MDLRFRSVKRMFVMQPIKKHDYAVVGIRLLRAGTHNEPMMSAFHPMATQQRT
jgi:hypothetical protein